MRKKAKQSPSFFKVLILDFTRRLRLPPVFVQKHGPVLPERVKLRVSDGRTWKVKVEQMEDDEKYWWFGRGWSKFAKDVGLEMGEFLVFRMTGATLFRVSVYAMTGCRREISGAVFRHGSDRETEATTSKCRKAKCNIPTAKINNKPSRSRSEPGRSEEEGSPLYYEILLKHHQKSRVTLRTEFVKAAGLKDQHCVKLEYLPGHRFQVVALDHREKWRTDLTRGWSQFRKANGIGLGKTYSLEFKPGKNVIQVKKVKNDD